jgi:hypothetical protein
MIEPTRIAAKEKNIMGILMVPGACRFSNPIPPPITSNKAWIQLVSATLFKKAIRFYFSMS